MCDGFIKSWEYLAKGIVSGLRECKTGRETLNTELSEEAANMLNGH